MLVSPDDDPQDTDVGILDDIVEISPGRKVAPQPGTQHGLVRLEFSRKPTRFFWILGRQGG